MLHTAGGQSAFRPVAQPGAVLLLAMLLLGVAAHGQTFVTDSRTTNAVTLPSPPVAASVIGTPSNAGDIIGARPNVGDIIGSPPPAVGNTYGGAIYIPPQISSYLPRPDTNPVVGMSFPPGSAEFVLRMAGITPTNAPARFGMAKAETVTNAPQFILPDVTYHLAAPGERFVNLREREADLVRDFPPGTVIRGNQRLVGGVAVAPGEFRGGPIPAGRIPYPEATIRPDGTDVIQDYPPGTVIVRTPAPAPAPALVPAPSPSAAQAPRP